MNPTWQSSDGAIQLYLGDCKDILPTLTGVDAVITDPPYGIDAASWDGRVPYELITTFLRLSSGPVVWFGSAPNVIQDAKSFPIEPDRMMIWAPKFTLSKVAKDGFAYRFHPVWWWRVSKQNVMPWDVYDDATEGHHWWNHLATKPEKLMRRVVTASTSSGSTVLDPFMGSGTTIVAAIQTGRKAIGIEIDEGYFNIAQKRVEQELTKMRMF